MNFWNEEKIKEALGTAKTYNFPSGWTSNGMVIWQENYLDGNMILARSEGESRGVNIAQHEDLLSTCSAIIATKPAGYFKYNKPVIEILGNSGDAIIKMARYIRQFFKGKVIAITGSSGKSTTTKMILDIFSSKFSANSNIESKANTSWGISWNMTRFSPDDDYWVIETSLGGGISRNSAIVKPDYAIIMNVAPVHLTDGMELKDIAYEKSKIFNSMKEGQTAIIYKGMKHFDIAKNAAEYKGLKIITFGDDEDADIRVIADGENKFVIDGKTYLLNKENTGHHLLLDMAAALAVVKEEKFPIEDALEVLRNFKTLEGRGEVFEVTLAGNKHITVTDESYNANPLSMAAAITAFGENFKDKNKVLILGDMAECGADSEKYHKELAIPIEKAKPQKIILCGKEIKVLYEEIKDQYEVIYHSEIADIIKYLPSELSDGDYIMLKSSHSGNLYRVVNKLKNFM